MKKVRQTKPVTAFLLANDTFMTTFRAYVTRVGELVPELSGSVAALLARTDEPKSEPAQPA